LDSNDLGAAGSTTDTDFPIRKEFSVTGLYSATTRWENGGCSDYSKLLICLRPELGEMFGRFHFRYLLGVTRAMNPITLAHQLEHHWFGMFGQKAIAKCRAYDHSRAGVEYVTKCLTSETLGKNDYELRKFNLSDTVTLSRSVFAVIADLERMGTDARHARVKRRGPDEGPIGGGIFSAND
jgi:hypothetical protein